MTGPMSGIRKVTSSFFSIPMSVSTAWDVTGALRWFMTDPAQPRERLSKAMTVGGSHSFFGISGEFW